LPSSAALDQAVAAVQFGGFLPPVSASPPNNGQPFEAAPSGSTVPAPIHQQVAAPLLQLRARGDGVHRLLLELHPADLGQVNVEVRLHSGEMKISLTSGSEAAREAIRSALPQLRTDLASVGLAATDISVNLGSSDASAGQGRQPDGRQAAVGQHNPGRAPEDRTGGADRVTAASTHPRYAGPTTGIDRWL
jgi:flagellar hook-length control protein FliK